MTIDKMLEALTALKEKVGGDAEVPVMATYGENDYIVPEYPVIGDLRDQDGNEFKCAFIGSMGGEELTEKGTPHYKWKPSKNRLVFEKTGHES